MGPANLIKYVSAAHTRICFSSVSPLQEAAAVGFEQADKNGFWEQSKTEMKGKMDKFCAVFDELGIPVCRGFIRTPLSVFFLLPPIWAPFLLTLFPTLPLNHGFPLPALYPGHH